MAEWYSKANDVFLEAAKIESPAERRLFLDRQCGNDAALRAQVESLLAASEKQGGFLNEPAIQRFSGSPRTVDYEPIAERPGTVIGPYKLLQQIGEGGMGVVYMADQQAPIRRRVALKIIKPGMDTQQVIARFEAERQTLALMDHPNIARVLDAGATDSGRPYFVMELVRGIPITDYCDQNNLSVQERLELFVEVCHAVQHAHQKGIIHRDIKPSNVLVTLHDGRPVPKVIDFGVAKATNQQLTDKTLFTNFAQMVGTPLYMSPEQAEMSGLDVDTRSDIYSLGVLLYELLTGTTPFDKQRIREAAYDEIRRIIREEEPPRPSKRISTLGETRSAMAAHRQVDPNRLGQLVRGDLDWIVMKSLEKDRTHRYETANGLAMDINRHLTNEPVIARPPSTAYRMQKAFLRNKLVFSAGVAVAAALLVGISTSVWQAARATRAKLEAVAASQAADAARQKEVRSREQAEADRERATASERLARRAAYSSDTNLAQQALAVSNLGRAQALLNRQRPQPGQQDLRDWEWRYLWSQARADDHQVFWNGANRIAHIAFSADGRMFAFADNAGLNAMDLSSRRMVLKQAGVSRFAFAHHAPLLAFGQYLAAINAVLVLWDTVNEREIQRLALPGRAVQIAFLPNDARLLTVSERRSRSASERASDDLRCIVSAWDVSSAKLLWQRPIGSPDFDGDVGHTFAVSPDGMAAAAAIPGGRFEVLDTESGSEQFSVKATPERVTALAFSPDGKAVLSGAGFTDSVIQIWDAANGTPLGSLEGHRSWVGDLVFAPDGSCLVSASGDQIIRVWDWSTRKLSGLLRGHLDEVDGVTFSPDGRRLASHCKDGSIYLWDVAHTSRHLGYQTLPSRLQDTEQRGDPSAAFTPDSQSILGVERGGGVVLWDAHTLKETRRLWDNSTNQPRSVVSADASRLVQPDADGRLHVWDVRSGLESANFIAGTGTLGLRFTDNGKFLITSQLKLPDLVVEVWESDTWQRKGSIITKPDGLRGGLRTLRRLRTPLGNSLALAQESVLGFFDVTKLDKAPRQIAYSGGFFDLAVSPDGRIAAGAFEAGDVRLWDMSTLQPMDTLKGFLLGAHSVAFSPDGKRLAAGSNGQEAVELWDAETRHEVLTLSGEGSVFTFLKFSPDGQFLLAINGDGVAHLWSAPSWAEIEAAEAK
jgi:serine/threonine protein kinase/WD40 repeat protein